MSNENKSARPVYDLGMVDTVLEDIPSEPPTKEDIAELLERASGLRMTPPIKMVYERIAAIPEADREWSKMDEMQQNCVLALFAVSTASLRDNVRVLSENAT